MIIIIMHYEELIRIFVLFLPLTLLIYLQLTIPLKTVTSITKERTALLIPNAILITTTVEKVSLNGGD
jgi:hypothetical protein